ncbi:MAG: hypothetical protein ACPGUD_10210 [Parashewanella sp.]
MRYQYADIVIIDTELAASVTAIRLLQFSERPLALIIISSHADDSEEQWQLICEQNIRALSIYQDDPNDFSLWLSEQANRQHWPTHFQQHQFTDSECTPYALFYEYIKCRLQFALSQAVSGSSLLEVKCGLVTKVLQVDQVDRHYKIHINQPEVGYQLKAKSIIDNRGKLNYCLIGHQKIQQFAISKTLKMLADIEGLSLKQPLLPRKLRQKKYVRLLTQSAADRVEWLQVKTRQAKHELLPKMLHSREALTSALESELRNHEIAKQFASAYIESQIIKAMSQQSTTVAIA